MIHIVVVTTTIIIVILANYVVTLRKRTILILDMHMLMHMNTNFGPVTSDQPPSSTH